MDAENSDAHFWRVLFNEGLSSQLADLADRSHLVVIRSAEFGDVQVCSSPATRVGDNYMSETYLLSVNQGGSNRRAFCKVI